MADTTNDGGGGASGGKRGKRWTAEEVAWLRAHIAERTWEQLAQRLARSVTAVRLKAARLGLSKTTARGYTQRGLAAALGVAASTVRSWRQRGWLRGQKRRTGRTRAQGGDIWRYEREDVRTFLAAHWQEIDFSRVNPRAFLELTMGIDIPTSENGAENGNGDGDGKTEC